MVWPSSRARPPPKQRPRPFENPADPSVSTASHPASSGPKSVRHEALRSSNPRATCRPLPADPPRRSATSRPARVDPPVLRPRRPRLAPLPGRNPFAAPLAAAAPVGDVPAPSLVSAAPKRAEHSNRGLPTNLGTSAALTCPTPGPKPARLAGDRCGILGRLTASPVADARSPKRTCAASRGSVRRPCDLASPSPLSPGCRNTRAPSVVACEPSDDPSGRFAPGHPTYIRWGTRDERVSEETRRPSRSARSPVARCSSPVPLPRPAGKPAGRFRFTAAPSRDARPSLALRRGGPPAGLSASPAPRSSPRPCRSTSVAPFVAAAPSGDGPPPSLASAAPKCVAAARGSRAAGHHRTPSARPPRRVSKLIRRRARAAGPSGDLETLRGSSSHREVRLGPSRGVPLSVLRPRRFHARRAWTEVLLLRSLSRRSLGQ